MSEEGKGGAVVDFKARREAKKQMNMEDLQNAVDTINGFAVMFRKAKMAIKNLERAEGQGGAPAKAGGMGGMFGGAGGDPFTSMMMGAVEQAVQTQATKIVEKKTAGMGGDNAVIDVSAEELAEAKGGLEGGSEEGEEVEE